MEARCAAFLVIAGLWDRPWPCPDQDEDFGSTITRDAFLEMCQPMMDRWEIFLEMREENAGIFQRDLHGIHTVSQDWSQAEDCRNCRMIRI